MGKDKSGTYTKVHFKQGFELHGNLYGWMNGELYELPTENNRFRMIKMKMHTKKGRLNKIIHIYKIRRRNQKKLHLIEKTGPIDFVYKDYKRNMNAYRPALKKDGFGIEPGLSWKEMDEDKILRK